MRYRAKHSVATAIAAAVLVSGAVAGAQFTRYECLLGKHKCTRAKMQGLLKCYAKAASNVAHQGQAFTDCVNKVKARFDGGSDPAKGCFARLEAKDPDGPGGYGEDDCLTFGDSDRIETVIDDFVTEVATALANGGPTGGPVNACQAGKDKCVFKTTAAAIKCAEKCVNGDFSACSPSTACADAVLGKYEGAGDPAKGCFAKLEAKSSCATTGDSSTLEYRIVDFAIDVLCEQGNSRTFNGGFCDPTPSPTAAAPTPTATP